MSVIPVGRVEGCAVTGRDGDYPEPGPHGSARLAVCFDTEGCIGVVVIHGDTANALSVVLTRSEAEEAIELLRDALREGRRGG